MHFASMELNAIIGSLQLLHILHVLSSWKTCPKVDQHQCWSLTQSKSINPKIANPFPLLKIILCSIVPFKYSNTCLAMCIGCKHDKKKLTLLTYVIVLKQWACLPWSSGKVKLVTKGNEWKSITKWILEGDERPLTNDGHIEWLKCCCQVDYSTMHKSLHI